MFNITVDDSKFTLIVDFASKKMIRAVQQGINQAGIELASYVKTRHLTGGTTEDRLGVRSGLLRQSAHGLKPTIEGDRVVGGAGIGGSLVYADVHINREGRKLVITPKNARALAIPFKGYFSRTGSIGYGRTKQPGPRDYGKGFLTPLKTKRGNMMLVHKVGGKNARIEPYYMLLKSVTVPARVFPERVMIVRRRYIVETIKNNMFSVFGYGKQ